MNINKLAIISALKELARLSLVALAAVFVSWLTGIQEDLSGASVWTLVIGLVIKAVDRYAYKAKGLNVTKI